MPRVGKSNNKAINPKVKVDKLTCGICGKTKSSKEFYQSYNPIHATGRLPYCKNCLKDMCLDGNGRVSLDKTKEMLKFIDRPFLYDIFKSSVEDKMETIGCYMKNIAIVQYRHLSWKDSYFEPQCEKEIKEDKNLIQNNDISNNDLQYLQEKYGYGFDPEEYLNFERKYKKLSRGYKEKTELHTERLITYITHKVKEEMATAKGDVSEAEKWAKLAQADATAAKLNVSQLSKSDITGGIDLLPQLVEAVEQHASLIPLLPKVLEQPYDDVDLIIWANIDYLRRLEDKPSIQYRDIWKFYDDFLEAHFEQKGLSGDEIIKEKQKRNNVFRDLSHVYKEPLYDNPDEYVEEDGDIDVII